jgi:glycosyltransferase involved in cell wall biosynthesis
MDIINISEAGPEWTWLADAFAASHPEWRWRHASVPAQRLPAWLPKRYPASRLSAAWQATGWPTGAEPLYVTHGPRLSLYTELSLATRRRRARHLAYTFSFTDLPTGREHALMARLFQRVDRFVSYSSMERQLYAEHFDLDIERLDNHRWAMRPPAVEPGGPFIQGGDYVCALGTQARDYATLVEAMRGLPSIRLVLVAPPQALAGLTLPGNVEVHAGIPLARAMNVLAHSRFTVVPLRGRRVPCGHSTLVPAMHLRKAVLATDSAGVSEYVFHGDNGCVVPPGDAAALRRALDELYGAPDVARAMGERGGRFASEHCSEQVAVDWLRRYLGV